MDSLARIIAFYLPQFHPIPENDQWWGKGFTEWTNVAKAKPLFRGHYQPRIPADLGFYDLRIPETRIAQAELAKQYGIEGFCYYHYWFGGKRILERPFNEVLDSGEPDFPFCLCWANHSWNSIWDGSPDKMLVEQIYPGMKDHGAHFNWLLRAFTDDRYITVDGKPLFLIYRADDIPEIQKVTDFWRELAIKSGLKGLHIVGISHWQPNWNPSARGLDAFILQRLPERNGYIHWSIPLVKFRLPVYREKYDLSIYSYKELMSFLVQQNKTDFLEYPCVLPNWDNTPRSGLNGLVLHGSTPELFRSHLRASMEKIADYPDEHKIMFLKAWNEWAEGNYVEPDLKFGHGYLEVIKDEICVAHNQRKQMKVKSGF